MKTHLRKHFLEENLDPDTKDALNKLFRKPTRAASRALTQTSILTLSQPRRVTDMQMQNTLALMCALDKLPLRFVDNHEVTLSKRMVFSS